MTEDAHTQANAEQVRVLREALAGAEPPGEVSPTAEEADPELPGAVPTSL